MKTSTPDVTIVVNAHNEGYLLHRTLKSLASNISTAKEAGITTEVIIVADRPDTRTQEYLNSGWCKKLLGEYKLEVVQVGSLSLARNAGYKLASGGFVGNLDGDDLWSKNYLRDAVLLLRSKNVPSIVHPEYCLSFGQYHELWRMRDSDDPSFDQKDMVGGNWWLSCAMMHREVAMTVPYSDFDQATGFSYEDWLWNCDTLYAGYEHYTVPQTVYFYRRKKVSVLTTQLGGLLAPTALLSPGNVRNMVAEEYAASTGVSEVANSMQLAPRELGGTPVLFLRKTAGKIKRRILRPAVTASDDAKQHIDTEMIRGFIPSWVLGAWRDIHMIEPQLFPSEYAVQRINESKINAETYIEAYWQLVSSLPEKIDYLLVTPWLKTGGADLVVCHYVNTLKDLYPQANVCVLATENTDSPWAVRLAEGVKFVQVGAKFHEIGEEDQARLLAQLLVQVQAQKLHVINSQELFRSLESFAPQIAAGTNIFLSIFAVDHTKEGETRSAFISYAEPAIPYITKIFTDNHQIIEQMIDYYGYPESLFKKHAMPVSLPEVVSIAKKDDESLQVLWASSVVKAKRPDVLMRIARKCLALDVNVSFTIFGSLGDSVDQADFNELIELPNVHYHGAFRNGIQGLVASSNYHVYMCTSETEGTPNAILEAMACELPVVAPHVGGIPELIADEETGFIVPEFDDIDRYVEILRNLTMDRDKVSDMGKAARQWIEINHSPDAFRRVIYEESDYSI